MTSGGNNFNDFPDNQLTKFCVGLFIQLVDPGFYILLKFLWSIAVRSRLKMREWKMR